jgi:hypothetical protein
MLVLRLDQRHQVSLNVLDESVHNAFIWRNFHGRYYEFGILERRSPNAASGTVIRRQV